MMNETDFQTEEWFSLDDITLSENYETLYCISVDAPERQFLVDSFGIPTHNTDEAKEEDALRGEAQMILSSIARLGRAAGCHLAIATQRPDATLIPGEMKANLGARVNAGRTKSTASSMILENAEGTRVRPYPRGRMYVQLDGSGNHAQGFFAETSWIDEYLEGKGLNPDGTPLSQGRVNPNKATIADIHSFEDADLDSREGIDTQAAIEEHIQQGEREAASANIDVSEMFDDGDFGLEEISEDATDTTEASPDNLNGTLNLTGGNSDKLHRPEEDWDSDLDDLIAENNS